MLDGSGNQSVLRTRLPVLLLSVFVAVSSMTSSTAQEGEFDKVVEVGVKPGQMMYDIEEFSVPPGGHIKLVFDNTNGTLQHNLLILAPGDEASAIKLAQKAWSMQNPMQNDYVPDSDQVLFATALLGPGEKETITFTAPEESGDHPYVCTMPGHAMSMNGMMHVRKPDTGDEQEQPGDAAGEMALSNLAYRYYEGKWQKLPSFGDLDPVDTGTMSNGKVSLEPAKRGEHYGLVFEGTLQIPADGEYTFSIASDDGSRLLVDGKSVAVNDGTHSIKVESGVAGLSAGEHPLRLEFFQATGGEGLQMSVTPPDGDQVYFSAATGAIKRSRDFRITSVTQPRVFRVLLPDAPSRSVAVGLPTGTHYCFDPTRGFVRYGWTGTFLDVGPERGGGTGRGGKVCKILGERFALGMTEHGQPLRFGSPDEQPEFSFRGYMRHQTEPPTMMYRLGDVGVRQQVRTLDGHRGVEIRYKLSNAPSGDLFFRVNRDAVEVSVSDGEWVNGSTLALPAKKQFTIALRNPEQD